MAGFDFINDWINKGKAAKSNYLDKLNVVGDPGGLGEAFNPNGNMIPKQPGVGAYGSGSPGLMVKDPTTGYYYDPSTGTTFMDPNGLQPVIDPNVAQQVAANYQRATGFLTNAGQVFGQQQDLAKTLNGIAQGRGPSAATMAGGVAMNQIANDQLSQASGVGGASAPLARLMAARNTAAAQTGIGNQVVMGRVNEATAARNSLASLLNATAGQQLTAGGNYSDLAATGQAKQQGLDVDVSKLDQEQKTKNQNRILGALSALAA